MSVALALLVALAATGLATELIRGWLHRRAILDHPNDRSSHSAPTPRGGGVAVVSVALLTWAALGQGREALTIAWPIILVAVLLMAVSWIDDRRGLPPAVRLVCHFAAAVAGVASMPDALLFQGLLSPLADHVLAVIAWVWFINLTNFMDGIDGITGVETASISLGVAILSLSAGVGAEIEASALVGAAFGFLIWNWHPARIFLGDVGSVPLGFLLGGLLIGLAGRGDWPAAVILPAYYLADATVTLVSRALAGERVWEAHRRHYYQIALRGGARHDTVVRRIALGNIVLVGLALLSHDYPLPALAGAVIVVLALLAVFGRMGRSAEP